MIGKCSQRNVNLLQRLLSRGDVLADTLASCNSAQEVWVYLVVICHGGWNAVSLAESACGGMQWSCWQPEFIRLQANLSVLENALSKQDSAVEQNKLQEPKQPVETPFAAVGNRLKGLFDGYGTASPVYAINSWHGKHQHLCGNQLCLTLLNSSSLNTAPECICCKLHWKLADLAF